jgi:hypothetical protein
VTERSSFDYFQPKEQHLPSQEQLIREKSFNELLKGEQIGIEELSLLTKLPPDQVCTYANSLVEKGMLVFNKEGAIVGSHGLSLIPTDHCISINGRKLFTWCALDAIGIPAALSSDARISSSCFHCHEPIEITMVQGEVQKSSGNDVCIWVVELNFGRSIVGCS